MRGTLFRLLLTTLTVLVLGAGTAHAAPDFARYIGSGGPVGSLGCTTSTIRGDADTATGLLGDVDGATYDGCWFTVTATVPWDMAATSPTTYTIDDIAVAITGPGCRAEAGGSANALYDSVSGVLTVPDQATVVTFVDPAADCFGLIVEGDLLPVLSDTYDVVIAV